MIFVLCARNFFSKTASCLLASKREYDTVKLGDVVTMSHMTRRCAENLQVKLCSQFQRFRVLACPNTYGTGTAATIEMQNRTAAQHFAWSVEYIFSR